ncbi:CHAT domain-containing protein [Streptomyces sp. NPDC046805]|uniref:CHAT domain-containing protein n=1 Tax=Streptomyces sp. NPDC046805 TaxID=3155134 RepID=UPI0033C61E8D
MKGDKQAALAAVRARVDAYRRTGDAALVLGPDADAEATRLVLMPLEDRRGRPDTDAFLALGWLRWCAHLALTRQGHPARAEMPYQTALSHLAVAHRRRPKAVPEPVAALLRRTSAVRRDPHAAVLRAGKELMAASTAGISPRERDDLPDSATQPTRAARRGGAPPALDDVIDTLYHVLAVTARGDGTHNAADLFLSMALQLRAQENGDRADLDRAIARLRWAVEERTTPADLDQARRMLGEALYQRGARDNDPAELDEAVTLLRAGIDSVPLNHPSLPARWALLADACYARHLAAPDPATLSAAITAVRTAIRVGRSLGHRTRVGHLTQLSGMLRERYQTVSDTDSLHESLAAAREAMTLASGDPMLLNSARPTLGRALLVRFRHGGKLGDILEAVKVLREQLAAVKTDPAPSRGHSAREDLAAALLQSYRAHEELEGDAADPAQLQEAIGLLRQVLAGPPTPRRATVLNNLGAALATWHGRPDTPDTLDEVIDAYRRAVAEPDLPSGRVTSLHNLAHGLAQLSRERGDRAALREAIDVMRTAASAPGATTEQRIADATRWADWAASTSDWPEALDGYRAAIARLPELVPVHLRPADQERLLAGRFQLAGDAAAVALQAGHPETALEVLEHGRSVLLSAALDADRELDELRSLAPHLAAELLAVQEALGVPHPDPDRRHTLGLRWERTLREIRRLPGFGRFLDAPRADQLRALVPRQGSVVTVNVSRHRCDALVLDRDGLRVVPLPDLHDDELDRRVREFTSSVATAESPRLGLVHRLEAQATVRETLGWLWDTVAAPVLRALGHTDPPPPDADTWPRVWWSPTGALNALPLHAAGHIEEGVPHGEAVLDRVVSSYTPTIRALRTIQAGIEAGAGVWGGAEAHAGVPTESEVPTDRPAGRPLVVAVPDTPGHPPLPATLTEATELGTAAGARLLLGPQATRAAVADALRSSGWAHLACHAHHDPANPSGSHLVLHDQPLMITDLRRLRASHAQLAYLSACSTARSTGEFVGESIHLGSAFRLVGFRHVVATLWQVNDQTAAQIARTFYAGYGVDTGTDGDDRVALALHRAVRAARAADPLLPTRWAAHIHTGP